MSRRHSILRYKLLHEWRRIRRNEFARTLRHVKVQEQRRKKPEAYVRSYVMKSIDFIERVEGRHSREEKN